MLGGKRRKEGREGQKGIGGEGQKRKGGERMKRRGNGRIAIPILVCFRHRCQSIVIVIANSSGDRKQPSLRHPVQYHLLISPSLRHF